MSESISPVHGTGATSGSDPEEAGTPSTPATASERGRPRRSKPRGPWMSVIETVAILVLALLLSWTIKTFLVQPFSIPSGSMNATLLVGDRVLVSKTVPEVFDVHRGDIVVFKDPGNWLAGVSSPQDATGPRKWLNKGLTVVGILPQDAGDHLIKRVIGVGGDKVVCCDAQGRVSVNGVSIDEPYIAPGSIPSEIEFSVDVPQGKLWVMGDNRQQSADSRYHMNEPDHGFVPLDNVVGTAFMKAWPFDRFGMLRNPGDTFAAVH